jgi:hypothetical protein
MCIGPARACPTTQPGHDRARPAACADASDPVAAAALQLAVDAVPAEPSKDPLADLTAELADFQRGVSRPGRLSLVGTMLQDSTAPELRARYRDEVIAPRRRRIRAILRRAQQLGPIDPDADLQIAVTLGTGSWYARALATSTPPPHWPERTAALVWRAVGGTFPSRAIRHRRPRTRSTSRRPARHVSSVAARHSKPFSSRHHAGPRGSAVYGAPAATR